MPRSPTNGTSIQFTSASAYSMCDGLLRMAHCFIVQLPEAQLKDVRYTLDVLTMKVDQRLESIEPDLSLNFDGLAIDPDTHSYPGAEDFGAVLISTTVSTTTDGCGSTPTSSSLFRQTAGKVQPPAISNTRASTPAPTPALAPAPRRLVPAPAEVSIHGSFPLVFSSRENVGFPDYTYHPDFVRPGIPGHYQHPPTASQLAESSVYYVLTKGLYVGIFSDWDEVAPWVVGVSGSVYRKAKSWEEAKDLYNARLSVGAVRILS